MSGDKRTLALVGVVVVLLGVGFFKLALAPKYAAQADLDQQIAAQQETADAAVAKLGEARAARDRHDANATTLVKLGKAIPEGTDTGSLIFQLETAAKRAGVTFKSLQVKGGSGTPADAKQVPGAAQLPAGTVAGPKGLAALPLELSFTGEFFELDRFLRNVRAFVRLSGKRIGIRGRLVVIDAIDLVPAEGGFPQLRATISATAFLRPPEGTAAAAPADGSVAATSAGAAATPGAGAAATPAAGAAADPSATPSSAPAADGAAATPAPSTAPASATTSPSGLQDR